MPRTLEDLVNRWAQIAAHAATYNLMLDDWLNDLDLRDIIGRRLSQTPDALTPEIEARLTSADAVFRAATLESNQSLWGPTAGGEHHPSRQWWYFRYPSTPGPSMRRDLETAGVLRRLHH
jgi:hypothetical protein